MNLLASQSASLRLAWTRAFLNCKHGHHNFRRQFRPSLLGPMMREAHVPNLLKFGPAWHTCRIPPTDSLEASPSAFSTECAFYEVVAKRKRDELIVELKSHWAGLGKVISVASSQTVSWFCSSLCKSQIMLTSDLFGGPIKMFVAAPSYCGSAR